MYFYRILCTTDSRKAAHFTRYSGHISDSANALTVGTAWRFVVKTHCNIRTFSQDSGPRMRQFNHKVQRSQSSAEERGYELRSLTNRFSKQNTVNWC